MNDTLISLHDKFFVASSNTSSGEVSEQTIFHYREMGDVIWATYQGGEIKFGTLTGTRENNVLFFHYQHVNDKGDIRTGKCKSTIQRIDGKITLSEEWQWTCPDYSEGTSFLVEKK